MRAAQVRRNFLEFFQARGHEVRPSSPLVPGDDPTLLFTNAGMVQFKGAFLGQEKLPFRRAVTSQKCVRAGGKHNDLEEVGRTARHHTFFEMLGNFSFGDYFKREAVEYAWEFLTGELGMDPDRLFVTVHHTDAEAEELWSKVAGVPRARIHRLGDKDNFWQMADTGPCGPCSEVHYDLRPPEERGVAPGTEEFEARGEAGEFLELWNLVFMQFDRDDAGTLHPLPAPSIDTGAGLERLAAVLQRVDANYHTDLFLPLLDRVAEAVGRPYRPEAQEGVSYRVLADHARAVAFLLADGVFPSNEGRGYVLRRILRRGVRHAWLLGRREPTLASVVDAVADEMADAYPELAARREHLLATTRGEEERFLATIGEGTGRLDAVAPPAPEGTEPRPVVPGDEVFRLYDTFGFPADLTRLMAGERGWDVDMDGFEAALARQRERSRADRTAGSGRGADSAPGAFARQEVADGAKQCFVGYTWRGADTRVIGVRSGNDVVEVALASNPFYAEGGGQVSDRGQVRGDGWTLEVEAVVREGELVWVRGRPGAEFPSESRELVGSQASAEIHEASRHDTERNHTATHLLHAALRATLGGHVVQRGSLVAPDRLRFDFAHTAPMTPEEVAAVEAQVNADVWADHPVRAGVRSFEEAVRDGAMALFGEKYGAEVRVVEVPGVSMELCGGTHVYHTGEIGLFAITSETGVAAGVRRLEAVTGPAAFGWLATYQRRMEALAASLKTPPENVERRVEQLRAEKASLEAMVAELRQGGGGAETLAEVEFGVGGRPGKYRAVRLKVQGADDARCWGDAFRRSPDLAVAVVAAEMPGGKHALFAFATDSAVAAGVRADAVVRAAAAAVAGRGGGRPHMAQAGVGDPAKIEDAVAAGAEFVEGLGR